MPLIVPVTVRVKPASRSLPWFGLGLFAIVLGSLFLRFWGLSRFNTLVFDEIYYARFASHFLQGKIIFTGHPPLSTYIIAFGIWVGSHTPWGNDDLRNGLSVLLLSPFSYRWLNAFTGAFIPLWVATIAYQLTQRRTMALIAALLIAADGLFLVESRYALNNVYLITFGLWGQIFFLLSLRASNWRRWLWLVLAGINFGCSAAIKWNGLGFLLGAGMIWALSWLIQWVQHRSTPSDRLVSPLQNLTQLHLGHILIAFVLIPAVVYYLCWLPYMQVDTSGSSFLQLQMQTLDYHKRVGGLNAHPYCSLWFSWPFMYRPVAYFYKTAQNINELVPIIGPPLPPVNSNIIYDVHAMGNPILWWLSTVAIGLFLVLVAQQLWNLFTAPRPAANNGKAVPAVGVNATTWFGIYIVVNWIANLLPWMEITRCAFLYHYMESLIFALLALALILDRWLQSSNVNYRTLSIAAILLVLVGFAFWMPFYLGLPLTPAEVQIRRWFPSWI